MFCEYCNTEFKTKSALNNHKNKAKYCLIIQGKIEPKEEVFKCNICEKILSSKQKLEMHKKKCVIKEVKEFKCQYCDKILSSKQNLEIHIKKCEIIEEKIEFKCEYCLKILSTKQILENHKHSCNIKKEKEQKEYKERTDKEQKEYKERIDKELKELKEKLEQQKKELKEKLEQQKKELKDEYKEQLEKKEEQIKNLQDKLEKLAAKAIDRPTTIVSNTTTNNHLNIATSIDFNDVDKIKYIIDNNLNINHVVDGQKGIALFVKQNILTDENGNSKYICTDQSRSIFKYKDSTGEIKKDLEAKKLTDYILKGGIRTQSANIGNQWCKDDSGDINIDKFNIMLEQQHSIMKLSDDNNSFKKELASISIF